jgi:hypothetical protein
MKLKLYRDWRLLGSYVLRAAQVPGAGMFLARRMVSANTPAGDRAPHAFDKTGNLAEKNRKEFPGNLARNGVR